MYVRHHVAAVRLDHLATRRAQGDVQHGAVLRDVDLLAAEHGVAPLGDFALLGKVDQKRKRLLGDAVLRVVQHETRAFRRELRGAVLVLGEQVAQMRVLDLGMMRLERLPGRGFDRCGHVASLAQRFCLGLDGLQQVLPRLDERVGTFLLQLRREIGHRNAGLLVSREHVLAIAAVR